MITKSWIVLNVAIMAHEMMGNDIDIAKRDLLVKDNGLDASNSLEW